MKDFIDFLRDVTANTLRSDSFTKSMETLRTSLQRAGFTREETVDLIKTMISAGTLTKQ